MKNNVTETVERILASEKVQQKGCHHLDQIRDVQPTVEGCEECLAVGDRWVHLRMCMICGKVSCCDDSKNKHARAHFRETGHPIVVSVEDWDEWLWCYPDKTLLSAR